MSPKKLTSVRSNEDWPRRELNNRRSITGSEGPPGLVLTLSLIPSDGVSTCHMLPAVPLTWLFKFCPI